MYTFFLEGVGGYSSDHAAAISSYSLLVYASGQCVMMPVLGALSDRCGRRALLLGAFTLDAAFMASYALASEAWWITASALMGLLDGAWVACHAVIADYVAGGGVGGGPRDMPCTRCFFYCAAVALLRARQPAAGAREDTRPALAVGFAALFVLGLGGMLLGFFVGYAGAALFSASRLIPPRLSL